MNEARDGSTGYAGDGAGGRISKFQRGGGADAKGRAGVERMVGQQHALLTPHGTRQNERAHWDCM